MFDWVVLGRSDSLVAWIVWFLFYMYAMLALFALCLLPATVYGRFRMMAAFLSSV